MNEAPRTPSELPLRPARPRRQESDPATAAPWTADPALAARVEELHEVVWSIVDSLERLREGMAGIVREVRSAAAEQRTATGELADAVGRLVETVERNEAQAAAGSEATRQAVAEAVRGVADRSSARVERLAEVAAEERRHATESYARIERFAEVSAEDGRAVRESTARLEHLVEAASGATGDQARLLADVVGSLGALHGTVDALTKELARTRRASARPPAATGAGDVAEAAPGGTAPRPRRTPAAPPVTKAVKATKATKATKAAPRRRPAP